MARTRRAFLTSVAGSLYLGPRRKLVQAQERPIPIAAVIGSWVCDSQRSEKVRAIRDAGCREVAVLVRRAGVLGYSRRVAGGGAAGAG